MWNVPFSTYESSNSTIAAFPNGGKVFCNQKELPGFSNVAGYNSVNAAQAVYDGQFADVTVTGGIGLNFWYGEVPGYAFDNRGRITYSIASLITNGGGSYDAFYDIDGGDAIGKIMMKCTSPFSTTGGNAQLSIGVEGVSTVSAWPVTVTVNPMMDCCDYTEVWTNGVPPQAVDTTYGISTGAFNLPVPNGTYRVTYAGGAVTLGNVSNSGGDVTNGLVGQWILNGNTTDSLGVSNATNSAVTFTTESKFSRQVGVFNGNSVAYFNQSVVPMNNSTRTLCGWIKCTTSYGGNGGYAAVFSTGSMGTPTSQDNACTMMVDGGKIGTIFGNSAHTYTTTRTITDNVWHHCAVTWDGTNLITYVDGISVAAVARPPLTTLNLYGDGSIGAVHDGTHTSAPPYIGAFAGELGDMRIYSRALSPSEINSIMTFDTSSGIINVQKWNQTAASGQGVVFANGVQLQGFNGTGYTSVAAAAAANTGMYTDLAVSNGGGLWFYYTDSIENNYDNQGAVSYTVTPLTFTGVLDTVVSVSASYNAVPTVTTSYNIQPSIQATSFASASVGTIGTTLSPITGVNNIPGAVHVPVSNGTYRITYVSGAVNYGYVNAPPTNALYSPTPWNIPFSAFINSRDNETFNSSVSTVLTKNEGRMYCNTTVLPGFDNALGFTTASAAASYYAGDYADVTVSDGNGLWFYYADSSGATEDNMGRIVYEITQVNDNSQALVQQFNVPTAAGLVTPVYGAQLYDKVQYFDATAYPDKGVLDANSMTPETSIRVFKSGTGTITSGELKIVVFYDKGTPYGFLLGTIDRQIERIYFGTDLIKSSSRGVYNYGQVSFYGSIGNESQGSSYAAGGQNTLSGRTSAIQRCVATTDTVTPAVRSQLTSAKSNLQAAKSSADAYFVGGLDASSAASNSIDKLAFANDTTSATSAAALQTALYGVASASDGNAGYMYFCGGRNGSFTTTAMSKMLPSNDTVMGLSSAALVQARYNSAAGSDSANVYIVDGRDSATSTRYSNVDKVNTFADTASTTWSAPAALDGQGAVGTSTALFLMGGADSSLEYGFVMKLNFADGSISFVSQLTGTTYGAGGATITRR